MILNANKLLGLVVKEKSGRILGTIKDFEFDTDNYQISKYIISPSKLVEKILANDLFIDKSQVIEITNKIMIVDDGLTPSRSNVEEIATN